MGYSASDIFKKDLLFRPDGQPYQTHSSIVKRLKKNGFVKTRKNMFGVEMFDISQSQIDKLNKNI